MSRNSVVVRPELIGLLIASVAIAGVSICYVLSPFVAALPVIPLDLDAAIEGARSGRTSMHLIGVIGMPGDALFVTTAVLLAFMRMSGGRTIEAMGWMLAGIGTLVFMLADAVVGTVLPQLASAGMPQAFLAAKSLFDLFFVVGTLVFGLGATLTALHNLRPGGGVPISLAWPILLSGIGNVVSASAAIAGQNVPRIMGLTIGTDAVLYMLVALALLKRSVLGHADLVALARSQ